MKAEPLLFAFSLSLTLGLLLLLQLTSFFPLLHLRRAAEVEAAANGEEAPKAFWPWQH